MRDKSTVRSRWLGQLFNTSSALLLLRCLDRLVGTEYITTDPLVLPLTLH